MTNHNNGNGNGNGGGDWSHPDSKPPHEPDDSQAPGPQGARQPQGGEWSGGHAHNPDPQQQQPGQQAWGEGPGHPQGGQVDQPPVHQPPRPGSGTGGSKLENNDIIAIVLSVFFPGVGQMMLGQTTKGIVILAVSFFTCAAGGLLSIGAALDAYCVAMARKKRPVDDWEFFPDLGELF